MIDWERVNELRRDFGEADFVEIVDAFVSEVQDKLDTLDPRKGIGLEDDFHFLKGSAANLGFRAFQAACGAAEQDPDPSKIVDLRILFQESKEEFFTRIEAAA